MSCRSAYWEDAPYDMSGWRGHARSVSGGSLESTRLMVQRSFKPGENVAVEIQPHCIPYVKTEGVQTIATAWGVKVEGLRDRVDGFLEHNTVSLHRPNMGFVLYVSPTTNNASLG